MVVFVIVFLFEFGENKANRNQKEKKREENEKEKKILMTGEATLSFSPLILSFFFLLFCFLWNIPKP